MAVVSLSVACGGDGPPPPPPTPLVDCETRVSLELIKPQLSCILVEGAAATAVFGYDNKSTTIAQVPVGPKNTFLPELDPRLFKGATQPITVFEPGPHPAAFAVTFAPAFGGVAWKLGDATASTLFGSPPACSKSTSSDGVTVATTPGPDSASVEIARDPAVAAGAAIQTTPAPLGSTQSKYAVGATPGSFSVGETGNARYQLMFELPPGRAGVAPTLGLAYDSRADNGVAGVGWSTVGVSNISRCGQVYGRDKVSAPVDFAELRFCLDGDPIVGDVASGGHPLHDPFTRVRVLTSDALGPVEFVVERKDGRVQTFGAGDNATLEGARMNVDDDGHEPSVQALPPADARLTWYVATERDRSFNMIRYHYDDVTRLPTPGCGGTASPCYAYEKRIRSVTYTHRGVLPTAQATRRVEYFYDDARRDRELTFVSRLPLQSTSRLERVEVWGPSPVEPRLLRSYRLTYDLGPISGSSRLTHVKECDGSGICKQPTTFDYEKGDSAFSQFEVAPVQYPTPFGTSLLNDVQVGDFNGDGLDDLIYQKPTEPAGKWTLRLATGATPGVGAPFGPEQVVAVSAPAIVPPPSVSPGPPGEPLPQPIFVDWNRDGKTDVLVPFYSFRSRRSPPRPGDTIWWAIHYSIQSFEGGKFVPKAQIVQPSVVEGLDMFYPVYPVSWDGSGRFGAFEWGPHFGDGKCSAYVPSPDCDPVELIATRVYSDPGYAGLPVDPPLFPCTSCPSMLDVKSPPLFVSIRGSVSDQWLHVRDGRLVASGLGETTAPTGLLAGVYPSFADANGDGLVDAIALPEGISPKLQVALNTGGKFRRAELTAVTGDVGFWGRPIGAALGFDYYERGRPAMLVARTADYTYYVSNRIVDLERAALPPPGLSSDEAAITPHTPVLDTGVSVGFVGGASAKQLLRLQRVLDVNGDGLDDLVTVVDVPQGSKSLVVLTRKGKRADRLVTVRDGMGDAVNVEYTALHQPASGCEFPVGCGLRGFQVVQRFTSHFGTTAARATRFEYGSARTDLQGLGFLGFTSKKEVDESTGASVTLFYDRLTERVTGVGDYPFKLVPTRVESVVQLEGALRRRSSVTTEYEVFKNAAGSFVTRARVQREVSRDLRPDAMTPIRDVEVVYGAEGKPGFDAFGNVLYRRTRHALAGQTDVFEAAYSVDEAQWLISKPLSVATSSATDATGGGFTRRLTRFETSPTTGLIHKVFRESVGDGSLYLSTELVRDGAGLVVRRIDTAVDGSRRLLDTTYDSIDGTFVSSTIDALGRVRRVNIHSGLAVTAETIDENGVTLRFRYDGFGRTLSSLAPSCPSCAVLPDQHVDWLAPGVPGAAYATEVTRAGSPSQRTEYDALGRVVRREFDGFSKRRVQTVEYVPAFPSKPSVVSNGALLSSSSDTTYSYDNLGRLIRQVEPGGRVTSLRYEGLTVVRTDPGGRAQRRSFDELGRPVGTSVITALAIGPGGPIPETLTSAFVYGPFGLPVRAVGPDGAATTFGYDRLGRRTSVTDPDAGTQTVEYSAFGDVLVRKDALHTTLFAYDSVGRPTGERSDDGFSCWTYDAPGALGYLSSERRVTKTAETEMSAAASYHYDALGRLRELTSSGSGGGMADSTRLVLDYDALGRIGKLSHPTAAAGLDVTYAYTPAGHLKRVDVDGTMFWTAVGANQFDQLTDEAFGNGVSSTRTYDPVRHWLRRIDTSIGSVKLQDLRFTYEPDGQLATRTEGGSTETFGYDGARRLTNWSGSWGRVSYGYDAGNSLAIRTTETSTGVTSESFDVPTAPTSGSPLHAIKSITEGGVVGSYSHDAVGNRLSGPGQSVTWSSFHLPLAIDAASGLTRFAYDASKRRVAKIGNGFRTFYGPQHEVRDGNRHVVEVSAGGRPLGQVVWTETGGTSSAKERLYVHTDQLGSPHVASLSDGSKAGPTLRYEPFGRRVEATNPTKPAASPGITGLTQGFTGHEDDAESGLVNMRGRIYDPRVARFLSPDPVLSDTTGVAWNPYAYVWNNPINHVDPTGFEVPGGGGGGGGGDGGGGLDGFPGSNTPPSEATPGPPGKPADGPPPCQANCHANTIKHIGGLTGTDYPWSPVSRTPRTGAPVPKPGVVTVFIGLPNPFLPTDPMAYPDANSFIAAARTPLPSAGAMTGQLTTNPLVDTIKIGWFALGLYVPWLGAGQLATSVGMDAADRNWDGLIATGAGLLVGGVMLGAFSSQPTKLLPNLGDGVPKRVGSFRLEKRGEKWVTVSSSGDVYSAKGRYIFVVQDGEITVAKQGAALGTMRDVPHHIDLSKGLPVEYAGEIQFGGTSSRGVMRYWTNGSGHYLPPVEYRHQAGLPEDLFRAHVP